VIIYKTTNLINGKSYIGQSKYDRNEKYLGSGPLLKKAIIKYGKKNFIKGIVEYCLSKEELDEKETFYIKLYNTLVPNGYNISIGGNRDFHNDKTSQRISNKLKGRVLSTETKNKIGDSTRGKTYYERYGLEKSVELKKIRKMFLFVNNPMKNGHTEESKQKISLSLIGHKQTEFQKKRVSECNSHPKTESHKSNLSKIKSKSLGNYNFIKEKMDEGMSLTKVSKILGVSIGSVWRTYNKKLKCQK
jgi:group I intron endonuclease